MVINITNGWWIRFSLVHCWATTKVSQTVIIADIKFFNIKNLLFQGLKAFLKLFSGLKSFQRFKAISGGLETADTYKISIKYHLKIDVINYAIYFAFHILHKQTWGIFP